MGLIYYGLDFYMRNLNALSKKKNWTQKMHASEKIRKKGSSRISAKRYLCTFRILLFLAWGLGAAMSAPMQRLN